MTRRFSEAWAALMGALFGVLAGGCGPEAGGVWFFLTNPTEKVTAEYRLPAGPLLVLVDDPLGQVEPLQVQTELAEAIGQRLVEYKAHGDIVPQVRLQQLRRLDPDYDNLPIRVVGQRVGAEAVLYVLVTRYRLQEVGEAHLFRGQLTARLRVINVLARPGEVVRLWPRELEGREVRIALVPKSGRDESFGRQVSRELVAAAAKKFARLFCDYEIDRANPDA